MAAKEGRSRGGLENAVLACLAAATGPLTPAEVLDELGDDLAYTTVMTTLTRLFEKRALTRQRQGRAYAYALAAEGSGVRSNVTAHRMHRLLDQGEDRAGVLARFVADLSVEDERLLAELLAREDDHR
jgi:predicted transcriptional regulator